MAQLILNLTKVSYNSKVLILIRTKGKIKFAIYFSNQKILSFWTSWQFKIWPNVKCFSKEINTEKFLHILIFFLTRLNSFRWAFGLHFWKMRGIIEECNLELVIIELYPPPSLRSCSLFKNKLKLVCKHHCKIIMLSNLT